MDEFIKWLDTLPDSNDINTWNFINMTKLNGKTYKILRKPRTQTYAVVIEDEVCQDIHMMDNFKSAETLYNTLINHK